jgi:hypothetical protein
VGVRRLIEANSDTSFTLLHRDWPEATLTAASERVTVKLLKSEE